MPVEEVEQNFSDVRRVSCSQRHAERPDFGLDCTVMEFDGDDIEKHEVSVESVTADNPSSANRITNDMQDTSRWDFGGQETECLLQRRHNGRKELYCTQR